MQQTEFPFMSVELAAEYVKIEPGDMTTYRFIVSGSPQHHNWNPQEGMICMVASVDSVTMQGFTFPLKRAKAWWDETKTGTEESSLDHPEVRYLIGHMAPLMAKGQPNPWTVRAALLAILKVDGYI